MSKSVIDFSQYDKEISEEEIIEIARTQNKTKEEVKADLVYSLKDLKYTAEEIEKIIHENNYQLFPDEKVKIGSYGLNKEFANKYLCHEHGELISGYSVDDMALVTGFGPTNSPTAGTLSIIFRILDLIKNTNVYTHIVIADLGALNSRKKSMVDLLKNTDQFISFLNELGFNDKKQCEIRTHNNFDHHRVFAIASSVLTLQDFDSNKEATEDMYKRLNLQGNDFSTMVDQTFTVADIILPVIRDDKKLVIVSAGLEEHYYPKLSQIVIDRIKDKKDGINELVSGDARIVSLYGKIINGLFPYVKMSKSIPDSAINIGNTEPEIKAKILNCNSRNEIVIMQMMELASNWDIHKVEKARKSFADREKDPNNWFSFKEEYLDFFISVKQKWDKSQVNKVFSLKDKIFYQ